MFTLCSTITSSGLSVVIAEEKASQPTHRWCPLSHKVVACARSIPGDLPHIWSKVWDIALIPLIRLSHNTRVHYCQSTTNSTRKESIFWCFGLPGRSFHVRLRGRRLYLRFFLPFQNAPTLLYWSIVKFNKLQIRSTALLFRSTPRFYSEILLQCAPLHQQVLVLIFIEYYILMLKDLSVLWILKPIAVLICSVPHENAPLGLRI